MTSNFAFDNHNRFVLILIVISTLTALIGSGPLAGSRVALLVTVALQVFLPGYLLARALGKFSTTTHPIVRFTWVLAAGLSLTIILGAIMRLTEAPLTVYTLILHGMMFALLSMSPTKTNDSHKQWQFSRDNLPYYFIVILSCLTITGVAYVRNQIRVRDFEDQTVFVSLADWLANDPDDPGLRSRRVGVENGDIRWPTDGWTYNHAAWVHTSGVPAAQLLWYDVNPLLAWTIPLIFFALAYQLTQRESAGALTAATLIVVGLLTVDGLVYGNQPLSFGQFALFQLNTLRNASTALMLPLALFVALDYLRKPSWQSLLITTLAGWMLVSLHPRQTLIFQIMIGATLVLWWLAQPSRRRGYQGITLLLALASLALLPLIQRSEQFDPLFEKTEQVENSLVSDDTSTNASRRQFIAFDDLPVVGATYILHPDKIFYHPIITFSTIVGLAAIIFWRRSLAAQYIFGATAATMLLLFTPVLTQIYVRLISERFVSGTVFALPVVIALGLTMDKLLIRISSLSLVKWGAAIVYLAILCVTLLEPVPFPASARDQIRAANQLQMIRNIRASDEALLASLQSYLPTDRRIVLLTPPEVGTFVVESIPHTLITGGRRSRNLTHDNTQRFYNHSSPGFENSVPWFDSIDAAFLSEYAVDYIVVEANDSRLPQLLLQPERFTPVDTSAGYIVFRVNDAEDEASVDLLFDEMNAAYAALDTPRWDGADFHLERSVDPSAWQSIRVQWERRLENTPDDDMTQYGLAMTYLMMGDEIAGLNLWTTLSEHHPTLFLFTEAIASIQRENGDAGLAVETLMHLLRRENASAKILVARALMTERYFFALDDEQLDLLLNTIEAHPVLWEQFVTGDQRTLVRQQAALLASAGRWDTSVLWLDTIDEVELRPDELTTQAAFALTQGDVDRALSILEPATDADWYAAKAHLHPDRWLNADNVAAQMYHALRDDARDANRVSLRNLIAAESPYIISPLIRQRDEDALQVSAVFGNVHQAGFPVRRWRVIVTNDDATIQFGETEIEAVFGSEFLTQATVTVDLPADIPTLTSALVIIEPRYSDAVTFPPSIIHVTLNRPDDESPPNHAEPVGLNFGESIVLESHIIMANESGIDVSLYWETVAALHEDYQIFVHIVDETGEVVAQQDSTPVDGRYPTNQWRTQATIADRHILVFDEPLTRGNYSIRVGIYRLNDLTRLTITPADERVVDDSLQLYQFSIR